VTVGSGDEDPAVGNSVIGGAVTGVADPDATGKTEATDAVAELDRADATGDPRGTWLVPQAARPRVAIRAAIIAVKSCPCAIRRMIIRRLPAPHGSVAERVMPHPFWIMN
jgi:hypothetical protein